MGPLTPHPIELVVGLVSFLAFFGLMARVLLPRIAKTLEDRFEATEGRLSRAADTTAEAERTAAECRRILTEARRDAAATRQGFVEDGATLIAQIRAEGEAQRAEIVATGQAAINASRALAEAELRHTVATVAVTLAGRIVGEPLPEDVLDGTVVESFFADLESRQLADKPVS